MQPGNGIPNMHELLILFSRFGPAWLISEKKGGGQKELDLATFKCVCIAFTTGAVPRLTKPHR